MDEIKELITRRSRQILLHSSVYYQFNQNIISDHTYDLWCKELYELQLKYPEIAKEADLHVEFAEFDGSSGFDLPYDNAKTVGLAAKLLKIHQEYKNKDN